MAQGTPELSILPSKGKLKNDKSYFCFQNTVRPKACTITHFQLRNLLWCTSQNSVLYTHKSKVYLWQPNSRVNRVITNTTVIGAPEGTLDVTSMSANEDYLALGDYRGGLYVQRCSQCVLEQDLGGNTNFTFKTFKEGAHDIINYVELVKRPGRTSLFVAANNAVVQEVAINDSWDGDSLSLSTVDEQKFDFEVNCLSVNNTRDLICVTGDSKSSEVYDLKTKKKVFTLSGHSDYGFACAWSPNGYEIATGNQDKTMRVYDIRFVRPEKEHHDGCIAILGAHLGAVRSIRYSNDGKYLGYAEPADFVHVFKTAAGYTECQTIGLFSEIAGFSFSPDSKRLFIGLADSLFGGIVEYSRPYFPI